jgi:hypothetical protein
MHLLLSRKQQICAFVSPGKLVLPCSFCWSTKAWSAWSDDGACAESERGTLTLTKQE